MNYTIRKKERKDCSDVAHVVTVAWNETYKGIVPDEFLNNLYLNEKERATNSYNKFNENDNHQYVLEVDNKVVGFVNVGSSDESDYDKVISNNPQITKAHKLYSSEKLIKMAGNSIVVDVLEALFKQIMSINEEILGERNASLVISPT